MAGDPIEFEIRPFAESDRQAVIELWRFAGLLIPVNDPNLDIDRKVAHSPELFFVGERGASLVATVMVGYTGHRGSVHYLAVAPGEQGTGVGAAMMLHAEHVLRDLGCAKIDLRVRAANQQAVGFYESIGYQTDDVVPMSLRLIDDSHPANGTPSVPERSPDHTTGDAD